MGGHLTKKHAELQKSGILVSSIPDIFKGKFGGLGMQNVNTRVGTFHIKMCSNVHTRVGTRRLTLECV